MSLLIVTFIDFWRQGAGHRARLRALLEFLRHKIRIEVAYTGYLNHNDLQVIQNEFGYLTFHPLSETVINLQELRDRFAAFLNGKSYNFVIVEYVELAFVIDLIDTNAVTILDVHDVISRRIESFTQGGLTHQGIQLGEQEEKNFYRCFDYVMAIQSHDAEFVRTAVGDGCLLVPHAVTPMPGTPRRKVTTVGFVASNYAPNTHGLSWFIDSVWNPHSLADLISLEIYGDVCNSMRKYEDAPGIALCGYVEELPSIYSRLDIAVNPVQIGAGLKIKNLEAMSFGVPLLTHVHGAAGLEEGNGKCFLTASSADEFASKLQELIEVYELRCRLSKNATEYLTENFSHEKCFDPLAKVLGV